MTDREFKAVKISRGRNGWGGPLVVLPTAQRDKIVAVTGGGIPPLAHRIAELTGGIAVDGFRAPPPESEMACRRRRLRRHGALRRLSAQAHPDRQPHAGRPVGPARPVHHRGHLCLRRHGQ